MEGATTTIERNWGQEFEQLKGKFDFTFLKNELDQIAQRCGAKPGELKLVGPAMIKHVENRRFLAMFTFGKREILVNTKKLLEACPNEESRLLKFVHMMIHEQIHAASSPEQDTVGFVKPGIIIQFEMWNEGVTEKLAQEIVRKYYDRKGFMDKPVSTDYNKIPMEFVDLVIRRIAEKSGVNESTVWNAIVRAMFFEHDLDISEDEDMLPPDFKRKLAWVTTSDLENGLDNFEGKTLQEFIGLKTASLVKQNLKTNKGKVVDFITSLARKLRLKT